MMFLSPLSERSEWRRYCFHFIAVVLSTPASRTRGQFRAESILSSCSILLCHLSCHSLPSLSVPSFPIFFLPPLKPFPYLLCPLLSQLFPLSFTPFPYPPAYLLSVSFPQFYSLFLFCFILRCLLSLFFTARCTIVQNAVLRLHAISLSVCGVFGLWSHRLEHMTGLLQGEHPEIWAQSDPPPCWFERLRHSIANCGRSYR